MFERLDTYNRIKVGVVREKAGALCANPICTEVAVHYASYCFRCLRTFRQKVIEKQDLTTKLYAVSGGELIKIGICAKNIKSRLVNMQTGSPVPLALLGYVACYRRLEGEVHRYLYGYRSHGEWFRRDLQVMRIVEMIVARDLEGICSIVK